MQDAKARLDAWREAEHRRDGLACGTSEWEEADQEVRLAKQAFDAAFAQAYARYAEEQFQGQRHRWSAEVDHRTTRATE